MGVSKWTLTFLLLASTFFFINGYAKTPQASTEKHMLSANEEMDLVRYLDSVLTEAGIPDDPRHYLIDISRPNLSKIDENDLPEKKEHLRRSLYILLIDLGSRKLLLLDDSNLISSATLYKSASEHFLTEKHLRFLKENRVYNELKVSDVKIIFKSLCPIWPWC
jgi:hypothetical protein